MASGRSLWFSNKSLAQRCESGTEAAWVVPTLRSVLRWNWRDGSRESRAGGPQRVSPWSSLFPSGSPVCLYGCGLLISFLLWRKYFLSLLLSFSVLLMSNAWTKWTLLICKCFYSILSMEEHRQLVPDTLLGVLGNLCWRCSPCFRVIVLRLLSCSTS